MANRKKLVVLSGAGMSAESGIPTFRASDGLWANHRIEEVATPEAWKKNPALVLNFYNQRRKQVRDALPNQGHLLLAEMELFFDVQIITQNIDDLHERAGSTRVLHLHGEINKARSTSDPLLLVDLDHWEMALGDTCPLGSQLRPHIVWFGEEVPAMNTAARIVQSADLFLVIGTSLQVYPAAGLVSVASPFIPKYVIDPGLPEMKGVGSVHEIRKGASEGMMELKNLLLSPTRSPGSSE